MARRPPPETDPDAGGLRRRILDGALDLVEKHGIGELSIRAAARHAGVTHQAPYHHFRDRAAILAALAREGFVLLRDEMIAAKNRAPARADARFRACGVAYVRFADRHRAHFRIMCRPELTHPADHPEVASAAAEAMAVLVDCVVASQDQGLAPRGDPMPLVLTAWSTAHGLASLWIDGPLASGMGGQPADLDHLTTVISRTLSDLFKRAAAGAPKGRRR